MTMLGKRYRVVGKKSGRTVFEGVATARTTYLDGGDGNPRFMVTLERKHVPNCSCGRTWVEDRLFDIEQLEGVDA